MPVTKATYTAAATWTASQLAGIFRSAFIDAGLMTDWYDSFLSSGIENRILEVAYNGAKTYGKTYYWFLFSVTGMSFHVVTGWNASTHVPTGTQYLDYFSTTGSGAANVGFFSSSGTTNILTRYTSAVDSSFTWFVFSQGGSSGCFMIPPASHVPAAWIDLDKVAFTAFTQVAPSVSGRAAHLAFQNTGFVRRSYVIGAGLAGATSSLPGLNMGLCTYMFPGRGNDLSNYNGLWSATGNPIVLPLASSASNPAYAADSSPIFTGLPYSFYVPSKSLPSDFGIYGHFGANTMTRGDKIIVSTGTEEWDILSVTNTGSSPTGPSPCFLARVV